MVKILFSILFMMSISTQASLHSEADGPEGAELPYLFPVGFDTPLNSFMMDMSSYDHLDPQRQIPTDLLTRSVRYFEANKSNIRNQRYMTIIDFRRHSSRLRMWVVNMSSGRVDAYWTTHGLGSDQDNDGFAERFSNIPNSKMSSVGFYLTGSLYTGRNGRSMYLHGLESTNSKAYERAIVFHGADYVRPNRVGRSWGCPAVEWVHLQDLLSKLERGSLLYIYGENR